MKRQYYYLVAGLQDITLDMHKLSMDQQAFKNELQNEIHPDDFKLVQKVFLPFDNHNLLNLLEKRERPFDERGNYPQSLLEESIKEPSGDLPVYMDRFIEAFKTKDTLFPGLSWENTLTTLFYEHTRLLNNVFLKDWFIFDQNINNLTTALICKKHDTPYENEIIGRDDVSESIRKSHARDFGLGAEIAVMDDLLSIVKIEDVQEREKALDQIRWTYLDDVTFFAYFTIEKLLAFSIKLGMVERWLALDKEHGSKLFNSLLSELKSSYELPETFTDK